jgi:hypothetical protein
MSEPFTTALRSLAIEAGSTPEGIECKKFEASVAKSNRPIDGFICRGDSKMLLYLILDDYRDRPASSTAAALPD